MASDNEVVLTMRIENADAKKKLNEVKKQATDTGEEVEKQGRRMSESLFFNISNMDMIFRAGAKAVGFLKDKLDEATNRAEQLGATKFFTGLSSGQLQKIKSQIESVGGSFDSFLSSYSKYNQMWSTRRYKGWDSTTMQAFGLLGINPSSATSSLDLLNKVIDKLAKMQDIGQRNDLAQALGIPQDILLAYMKGGVAGNRNLFLTDEEIAKAEKMNNNIRQTWQEIRMIIDKLVISKLLPVVERLTNWQRELWGDIGEKAGVITSDLSKSREQILMSTFKKLGMSEAGAKGVIGNLMEESKLDPLAFNEKEGAFGIAQWRGVRLENLKKFAESMGEDYKDLQVQAAYLAYELGAGDTGKNPEQYRALKNYLSTTTDAGKAAGMFDEVYERSSGKARARRIAYATGEDISKYMSNYNTSYSSASNVVNNYNQVTVSGLEGQTPSEVANSIVNALASQ